MRRAIVGSRRKVPPHVRAAIRLLIEQLGPADVVVTGDATGVDSVVRYAAEGEHLLLVAHAPWTRFGNDAGPRRNLVIADVADEVWAFPDPLSVGTYHCTGAFERLGKPVHIQRIW